MQIPKNYDVVSKEAPTSGTDPFANPQIKPSTSPVPDTPGEKATNVTTDERVTKKIPAGPKGAGYYG